MTSPGEVTLDAYNPRVAIETVLFDYSGVLTTSLGLADVALTFDQDAMFVEMAAALAGSEPHPWHELERGEISLDAYCEYIESKVPGSSIMFASDSDLNVMANLDLRTERVQVAERLRDEGKRVGLVTNNVAEWQDFWLPRLPTSLFETVIDSAAVGCRKPEPEIYQLAMQQLGVSDAASVLFIDDFEWNVAGAEAVGMVGLHCPAELDLDAAVDGLL